MKWALSGALLLALASLTACVADPPASLPEREIVTLDSLGIAVNADENRPVSFTNKRSAFFYTQTHRNDHPEHAWFRGLNIAKKRVFSDLAISLDGVPLDYGRAKVDVFPDRLVRTWDDGVSATLRLLDYLDLLEIELSGSHGPVEISISGDGVMRIGDSPGLYTTMEMPDHRIVTGGSGSLHYVLVIEQGTDAATALEQAMASASDSRQQDRLSGLVNGVRYVNTSDHRLTRALRWLNITMDQLVTRQNGDGIYAGLPWFNEYWGRDSFIALPGALLVTGEFETARAVLTAFAQFQDMDPDSKFYGRVPNIVQPDALNFHTTDGTPRFAMALNDYIRYSGDRDLARELYPNIKASIDGALKNWTDDNGYLTHEDNETWMDARRAGDLVPYSPRGSRANDIQALWLGQLQAGIEAAAAMEDRTSVERWVATADQLKSAFQRDFLSSDRVQLADRLDAADQADFSLRPNQLYAMDLVDDPLRSAAAIRSAWENLVYPWGVASLDQDNPMFHPYHLAWDRYHKDQAYHNGTIWLWNNGIAMQRMIEMGQVEPAWLLFQAMNDQVLDSGVVGGLAENMDAYPLPGEDWPRLTGTYLQAWSNSEQLRIWYQYFLGVRPDAGSVTLAPRLPARLGEVDFSVRVGAGVLRGVYRQKGESGVYRWDVAGLGTMGVIDLPGLVLQKVPLEPLQRLTLETGESGSFYRVTDQAGAEVRSGTLKPDARRAAMERSIHELFEGVRFARPRDPASHPVMQQEFER
ncbi:MAG: amylo-alpha-1,6-glucosidase [Xanthomonadales bacterium]|nr:amylo-alpha-1,6-glucosidase [Xanthomonadales bacterium]